MESPKESVNEVMANIMRADEFQSLVDFYANLYGYAYIARIRMKIEYKNYENYDDDIKTRKAQVLKYLDEIIAADKRRTETQDKIQEQQLDFIVESKRALNRTIMIAIITIIILGIQCGIYYLQYQEMKETNRLQKLQIESSSKKQ